MFAFLKRISRNKYILLLIFTYGSDFNTMSFELECIRMFYLP